jgi:hypothetical protein
VNSRITNTKGKELVILTYLTQEEENILDEQNEIILKRANKTFSIRKNNIYCYGDVDLNEGSDDSKEIANFDFLDYLNGIGIKIPSDYNYEHHVCYSPLKKYRITETWKPDVLVRYAHGCLNKPKKILLFRLSA